MGKEYIECSCGTHVLKIDKDSDGEVYLTMYEYGRQYPLSWGKRLSMIWRVLRGISVETMHDMVLTSEEYSKFKEFMIKEG